MMIMSSFRLKTYLTRSFQHSVSILTNILAFFVHHLLKIRMIPSPAKHIKTNENHTTTNSAKPSQEGTCFQVPGSYKTLTLSLWINTRSLSTRSTKQWMNERPPKLVLVPIPPSWKIYLETSSAARTWQGPEYKVPRRGHKKKQRY